MKHPFAKLGLVVMFLLALVGCGGGDDSSAPPPSSGGPTVAPPTGQSPIRITANTPPATFAALKPVVKVGGVEVINGYPVVAFSMADADNNPIIGFGSTSKSSTATVASYPNLAFSLAKLVPGGNGVPSKWVSYIVTTVPTTTAAAAPTRPSTDNTGTLVDNGNGTYRYTFYRKVTDVPAQLAGMTVAAPNNKADLGDTSWAPNLTHRFTIQVSGNAPGTGTNTPNAVQTVAPVPMTNPVDVIYDFVPATGKAPVATDPAQSRDIAANKACEDCHSTLGGIPGDSPESSGAGFHGGSRNNVQYCVVCHTEQRRYGRTAPTYDAATMTFKSSTYIVDGRTVGDLPNFIHKTHLGSILVKSGYDYGGVRFDEGGYSQDIRNCQKCHDGSSTAPYKTAQGDNWKSAPSRLACGSCHDGIDFATGSGVTLGNAASGNMTPESRAHPAGPQADDSRCALCHTPADIDVNHLPVTPPNAASALHVAGGSANTNSAWIASNTSRLPAGAIKVSYEIKSVSRNASKQPVIVFRMLQNGARKDLNVFATTSVNPLTGTKEIWDNFMGSPSLYFVFAVPQDGIDKPADFNASASGYLKNIWNGTATGTGAGTLTGPDADGFYTGTLTGVTVPDNAVMLTGGVGYSYNVTTTLPLTQTNVAGYPVSPSPIAHASGNEIGGLIVIAPNIQRVATGYTGRRPIVEDARCNKCHQELGTFTEEAFHGGQRNDATTCSWCHTPNRTSSGWSADSIAFVHAIHAGAKRTVPYNWHAPSPTWNYGKIKYPGILARCEQCHLPDTYNFAASASAAAVDNRLYRTVATGILSSTGTTYTYSPYITKDVDYGLGFTFNAGLAASGGVPAGGTREAAGTTLVTSPTAAACSACHDSDLALSHIRQNGGSFYYTRTVGLQVQETCLVCHASGKVADIKQVHAR